MKMWSDSWPVGLLLLVLLFCVYYENQKLSSKETNHYHRTLIYTSQNTPEEDLNKNIPPPSLLLGGLHRGSKYNISAFRSRISLNRNASRFSIVPLPPPPPPTESSCQLTLFSNNDHKILLFVDNPFFNHFLNWLAHFQDVCGKNHYDRLEVICMDHAVIDKVEQATTLQCSQHSFILTNETFHLKHKIVWRYRMTIIVRYLEQNISLLLSDLDALWRKDPYPDIRQYIANGHNVIASRGLWPQKLSDQWGAAVCMGFIFLRSTPFSINLMSAVLNLMENSTPDDQQAINTILFQWNITWSTPRLPLLRNPYPDIGLVPFFKGHERVLLLPHDFYIRNCTRHRTRAIVPTLSNLVRQRLRNVTIAHCVAAPGNSYKKYLHLQVMGMWHGGVPAPLRNESLAILPKDTVKNRVRKYHVYNSSSDIKTIWKKAISQGSSSEEILSMPPKDGSDGTTDTLLANSNKINKRESASQALIRMHKHQKEQQLEMMSIGELAPKGGPTAIMSNILRKNNQEERFRQRRNKDKKFRNRLTMSREKRFREEDVGREDEQ